MELLLAFKVKEDHSVFKNPTEQKEDNIVLLLCVLQRFCSCRVGLAGRKQLLGVVETYIPFTYSANTAGA